MKPILKWAGGKSRLSEVILNKLPDKFNNYYEPFLGGGAIALEIYKKYPDIKLYLSDINIDLINFYNDVGNYTWDIINTLSEINNIFNTADNKAELYYHIRDEFNKSSGLDRSKLFYFINKTTWNGLTRYNSKGEFNVPYGKRDFVLDIGGLLKFSKFVNDNRVKIYHGNYSEITPNIDDFIYIDPPYHPLKENVSFTAYHIDKWTNESEIKLKEYIDIWEKTNHIMLSNNDVPYIRNLFNDYNFDTINVSKMIGAGTSKNRQEREIIITNYES